MRFRPFRHLTVAAIALVTMAACSPIMGGPGPAAADQPPPAEAAPPAPAAPPAEAAPPAAVGRSCRGAVVHPVDAAGIGRPWPRLCIQIGGVLRLENLGPDGLRTSPTGKLDCFYAAGVHSCRLVHTGSVRLDFAGDRQLTLDIAGQVSPPRPAPACDPVGTYTVDASQGGPPPPALCVQLGAVLRIANLGPAGFTATPENNVSCRYEAGVRDCRTVRAGTVTLTTTYDGQETRTLNVVVLR